MKQDSISLDALHYYIDIAKANDVEIRISQDNTKLWVNIDGMCRFRCYRIKHLSVVDEKVEAAKAD